MIMDEREVRGVENSGREAEEWRELHGVLRKI